MVLVMGLPGWSFHLWKGCLSEPIEPTSEAKPFQLMRRGIQMNNPPDLYLEKKKILYFASLGNQGQLFQGSLKFSFTLCPAHFLTSPPAILSSFQSACKKPS